MIILFKLFLIMFLFIIIRRLIIKVLIKKIDRILKL